MIELSKEILAEPLHMTSVEGFHCALMLSNIAWNREIDKTEIERTGNYLSALAEFERDNPQTRGDLVSYDCEQMITDLRWIKRE